MSKIPESELILNPDGSIYHLNLHPEDIADTIITVGDPERVDVVTSFFDKIEIQKGKREFVSKTGLFKGKRISVISTGIGTDNIDIVLNELDALVNIDLMTREIKPEKKSLKIIRIGTSGCLKEHIPIDSVLLSSHGMGLDGLLSFYEFDTNDDFSVALSNKQERGFLKEIDIQPYIFGASEGLLNQFKSSQVYTGITTTCTGFYAPQGRQLRLKPKFDKILDVLGEANLLGIPFTNFEMETAGIYALASLLGHQALSINLLIANRYRKEFSSRPKERMKEVIEWTLTKL